MHAPSSAPSIYSSFDGEDICGAPIEDRKRRLATVGAAARRRGAQPRFADDGVVIFKPACVLGCEGTMSTYRPGRVNDWLKIKNPAAPAVRREAEEDRS